jgi:large subunit ribosomal protein L27
MAHTKAQKTVSGNRDSQSKRLGIKVYGGEGVKPGYVIVRQRGSKINAGPGTMLSKDFTIIALIEGTVKYFQKRGEQYVAVTYAK